MSSKKTKKSGQTLIEVMVALAVLTMGMLGILELLSQSIHISKTVSDQTTATYLAAEGVELSKNIIDHDVYQHLPPGTGTGWGTAFGPSGGEFEIDYTTCNTNNVSPGSPCPMPVGGTGPSCETDLLYYDATQHTYLYPGHETLGSPTPTAFSRCIKITPNGADEITVQSTIYWGSGFNTQKVELEDDFYNWYPT